MSGKAGKCPHFYGYTPEPSQQAKAGFELELSQIAVSGPGFTHSGAASLVVPPGGTGPVGITFASAATGPAAGSLTFHADDPNTPAASVALSGLGTPEPPAMIAVSPGSVAFGAVPLQ